MNNAAVIGMRGMWQAATSQPKTMTAREMALASWGKVHANVNVNHETGERWTWNEKLGVFVAS